MLNLNIVNPQLWITTSTSSKVAPGQKVCHPTLRCHNLSTRVFWVLQVTDLFVCSSSVDSLRSKLVNFWSAFFGLDDQDFAQVTHAAETCVTTPCTASIAVTSPLPRKNLPLEQQISIIVQTKYFSISLNLRVSNRIPTFKYNRFSVSPFQISILGPRWDFHVCYTNETHAKVWKRLLPARPTEQRVSSLVEHRNWGSPRCFHISLCHQLLQSLALHAYKIISRNTCLAKGSSIAR